MRSSRTPHSSYALLCLGEAHATSTVFDGRGARAGGAIGTAIAAHVFVVLALWGVMRMPQAGPAAAATGAGPEILRFVFEGRPGDSGGRSGGGNRSQTAPLLRTRGVDALSVPVASARSLATPDTIPPDVEPSPAFTVPVKPMDAGAFAQVGALDGVPGPPTSDRGPGNGGTGSGPEPGTGLGGVPGPGIGDGPVGVGAGITPPTLIYRAPPQYTPEAMRAKIQGVAFLTGVVGVDGMLHDIRIVRSLDGAFGLDQEAIKCVKQWRFRPGTRQGKPVAVFANLEVAFNLR
jgi:TonB family protein